MTSLRRGHNSSSSSSNPSPSSKPGTSCAYAWWLSHPGFEDEGLKETLKEVLDDESQYIIEFCAHRFVYKQSYLKQRWWSANGEVEMLQDLLQSLKMLNQKMVCAWREVEWRWWGWCGVNVKAIGYLSSFF